MEVYFFIAQSVILELFDVTGLSLASNITFLNRPITKHR